MSTSAQDARAEGTSTETGRPTGGLLAGKRLLITGVLSDTSIAFHVARIAQREGARVVLTSFGRALPITEAMAERLPMPAPVVRLDVTERGDLDALQDAVAGHLGGLDGIVHSIAFAPGPRSAAPSSTRRGRTRRRRSKCRRTPSRPWSQHAFP